MKGAVVLVTGANRGLGLEFCRQAAAAGAEVLGTVRDASKPGELSRLGVRVEQLDVTDGASVAALAERLADVALDVLVNNAGIGGSGAGIGSLDFERLERLLAVNAVGPLRVTQALLPALERGRLRRIVQISSNLGSLANNTQGGYYGYRASKAALNMLNRSLALELASRGFTCVVLHPGWVRTRMGGSEAPLTVTESVAGLLRVIDALEPAANGRFFDHRGDELPW